jgi:pimeloyl-ACP methyl ester carboxylesterase
MTMEGDKLELRIYGDESLPTLIYLPGLHGDWTLIGSFRRALGGRVRFVEATYPDTLTWSLEEYAAGVETALAARRIGRGWLLGESFSSQVVWPLVARGRLHVDGVILAGGFVRHPMRWVVPMAGRITAGIPLPWLRGVFAGYARLARFRFRHSPETRAGVKEFISRWTELHRQAAAHRLRLIAQNDPSAIARQVKLPVYALTGGIDPIVPWYRVRRWLKRNCPGLRECKVIWPADHNVLSTAAQAAADQVVRWMAEQQSSAPMQGKTTDGLRRTQT